MDFGFPAMLAMLFLMKDTALLVQSLAVCLLHEAGHGAAMLLTGSGIQEIRLHAAGIRIVTADSLLSGGKELVVLYSGPAANLLVAALLFRGELTVPVLLHLGMGLFNLLPFSVLDGGAALLCMYGESAAFRTALKTVNILLSLLSAAVLFLFHVYNPCLYLMALYLLISELLVDKQGGIW